MTVITGSIRSLPGSYYNDTNDIWAGRAKTWCNWNGQGGPGVRRGHRVSSISDLGTAWFRVNHSINLSNGYAVALSAGSARTNFGTNESQDGYAITGQQNSNNTTVCTMDLDGGGSNDDMPDYNMATFEVF